MSKSKSDIVRLLIASLALAGCDAMRVPEPGPSTSPLRAAFKGVVVSGRRYTAVEFSRPISDDAELSPNLPWFDDQNSNFIAVGSSFSSRISNPNSIIASSGLRAYSYIDWPDTGTFRLRGVLKWNASAPFALSAGKDVVDAFDLQPELAERIVFQRGLVRADIGIRWPRLASARPESLVVWSKKTDSVSAFLRDWKDLCLARGAADEKILAYNQKTSLPSFQWKLPDTGDIRRIMAGIDLAQTVFAAGDSIWTLNRRAWSIYLGISPEPANPVWGSLALLYDSYTEPFSIESFSGSDLSVEGFGNVVRYNESYGAYGQTTTSP
ncbi:MAG: hypothetical protein AAB214_17715, partial [Fibrobacterota bacterium]